MRKNLLLISIICIIFPMSSCNYGSGCSLSRIYNETNHRVKLITFINAEARKVIHIDPLSSKAEQRCKKPKPVNFSPMDVEHQREDSAFVVFDDTLFLRYTNRGCCCETKNPVDPSCFQVLSFEPLIFAYYITDEDYSLALERYIPKPLK